MSSLYLLIASMPSVFVRIARLRLTDLLSNATRENDAPRSVLISIASLPLSPLSPVNHKYSSSISCILSNTKCIGAGFHGLPYPRVLCGAQFIFRYHVSSPRYHILCGKFESSPHHTSVVVQSAPPLVVYKTQ
ncbi:MAG: hypothetical protein OKBPIBMD_01952 [Chlorobi bacterium]|nr:hypothetical protein [Chlorobiota bacterium]